MKICFLGWGSLLWDTRPEFDEFHESWDFDGPEIHLEFSRISSTRSGALTLVIDQVNGSECKVAYTKSKRTDPNLAIEDLRLREGTSKSQIGVYFADGSFCQTKNHAALQTIESWSKLKNIDITIWTDLQPNFQTKTNQPFSIVNAITHLNSLSKDGLHKATEYIHRAPAFIDTPLRKILKTRQPFQPLQ